MVKITLEERKKSTDGIVAFIRNNGKGDKRKNIIYIYNNAISDTLSHIETMIEYNPIHKLPFKALQVELEGLLLVEDSNESEWVDIPSYGDLMTMEVWIECVECGGFIDYDGSGQYATENKMLEGSSISPSDLGRGLVDTNHTHVIWYNR